MHANIRTSQTTIVLAMTLALTACGGGSGGGGTHPDPDPPPLTPSDPEYHLSTPRFTTHQPDVLEQVGAHHAYALGLTGKGVRIGIHDDIVDFTQTEEFGNRVALTADNGAQLAYWRPPGQHRDFDSARCAIDPRCTVYYIDSQGDEDAMNQAVRQIVDQNGWPLLDDSVYIIDEHYSETDPIGRLYRAWEVPAVYDDNNHGTIVGSSAAGARLGVAPGATIIPVAKNFARDGDQADEYQVVVEVFLPLILSLPPEERRRVDEGLAALQSTDYAKFDIINRSFGTSATPDWAADIAAAAEEDALLQRYLPQFRSALYQTDRAPDERTIIVYAAGNDNHSRPGWSAALPYYQEDVRGHHLVVAATDPDTRRIAGYSDRCGPLPADWNSAVHGPHFCLAAPGSVRGLVPDPSTPGQGEISDHLPDGRRIQGTSFAAPVVSGALALMMEHFRGRKGSTEIVRRMLNTADRTGVYADSLTYGAGHLDLEAALSPVGTLTAGQQRRALSQTTLQTPAAFGSVSDQLDDAEVATFDAGGFPFWVPVSGLISARSPGHSPIPEVDATEGSASPAAGLESLGAHWASLNASAGVPNPNAAQWITGFAPGVATIARRDATGWEHGFSFEEGRYLGAKPAGGFGSNLHTGMFWTSRSFEHDLGAKITLDASATIAASLPRYESNAIFEASPSLLSAAAVRVGTERTGLTLEQPLRAESGTGTFRLETGWVEDGERLYAEHRVGLAPDARELRATLRHDREAFGGTLALQVSGALDAGHVRGEHDAGIGVAWRTTW